MNLLVLILDRKQPENGRLALGFPIDFEQILALLRHHNLGKKTSWLLGVSRTGLDTLLLMVLSTQEKSSEHHSWIKNRDTIKNILDIDSRYSTENRDIKNCDTIKNM